VAVVIPATEAAIRKVTAAIPAMSEAMSIGMSVGLYMGLIVTLLILCYPVAVLIVMTRPSVAAAFRGELPETEREPEDYWDEPRRQPDEEFRRPDGGFTEKK
jgi:hypothetical protein